MHRALDIFSGVGGSSCGAQKANVDTVCGIDMCKIATSTFVANFPDAHVSTAKLEHVKLNKLRDRIGDVDILLASPECTNHTCARGSRPRSEASRETAMQVLRFARAFRPRWLVLENVIHMRPWSRYPELKSRLHNLGYNLREEVFDATDFGVPQRRNRIFIIGDREKEPARTKLPRIRRRRTVRDILDSPGTWPTTPLNQNGRARATLERAERGFNVLGEDASFLLVYYGSDGSGGWQPLDRPLRTITTVDRFALLEPSQDGPTMRMLQVSELKRAMGFANAYKMPVGNRRDKIRLLGNSVCPPVMKAVLRSLT